MLSKDQGDPAFCQRASMWNPNIFINNTSSYFSYQNENKEINITHSNVTKINSRNITLLYENKVDIIITITDNKPNIMATKSNHSFLPFFLWIWIIKIFSLSEHQVILFSSILTRNTWTTEIFFIIYNDIWCFHMTFLAYWRQEETLRLFKRNNKYGQSSTHSLIHSTSAVFHVLCWVLGHVKNDRYSLPTKRL